MPAVMTPPLRAIHTRAEHQAALARIEALMDSARPASTEEAELEVLVILVKHFEDDHEPIRDATPAEAVAFALEQHGETRRDLEKLFGSKGRVSEFFADKRALSKTQILRLMSRYHLPAETLLGSGGSLRHKRPRRTRSRHEQGAD